MIKVFYFNSSALNSWNEALEPSSSIYFNLIQFNSKHFLFVFFKYLLCALCCIRHWWIWDSNTPKNKCKKQKCFFHQKFGVLVIKTKFPSAGLSVSQDQLRTKWKKKWNLGWISWCDFPQYQPNPAQKKKKRRKIKCLLSDTEIGS